MTMKHAAYLPLYVSSYDVSWLNVKMDARSKSLWFASGIPIAGKTKCK